MNNIIISIIIPVYKAENYIQECIQSAINQTFKDIEIICIDDCGLDNSINIVNELAQKDDRIKIFKHPYNKGVGPARNTGIINAKGEYIFFLDSDDYLYDKDLIKNLYNKIVETNADFVTINYLDNIDELAESVFDSNETVKVSLNNFSKVLDIFPIVVWGKLFKTSFLKEKNLKFIESKTIHEDDGFTIKLLSAMPTYTAISQYGYFYRQNPSSIMHTRTKTESLSAKRNVIKNAVSYIYSNCKNAKTIAKKVETSYKYSKYLSFRGKYFRFCWHKYYKHIVFCAVELYKEKMDNDKMIKKLLGIKVK